MTSERAGQRPVLHIVHCVDVEGPMTETLEATWERILSEDGIRVDVAPTLENLRRLQTGELDAGVSLEKARVLQQKYSVENLAYLQNWESIDDSIRRATSREFRRRHGGVDGGGYVYSWFIYDHYGFTTNPRFHDDGIHHIFDHYHDLFLRDDPQGDGVYWHYHHPPVSGDALEWNTGWTTSGVHEEILARRVIERGWFPSVFRAGGHIERNDLSHWMEMFVPFDYSARTPHDVDPASVRGSVLDWRHAPKRWGYYHPDWYDYRRTGQMRRSLFRCLDLKTWIRSLEERDVREAFAQARSEGKAVMAYYNHDYRDMGAEVEHASTLLKKIERDYTDVRWKYSNALDAARDLIGQDDREPRFTYEVQGSRLTIRSDADLFGPQPFLAIQENGRFFRDNTTQEGPREWVYVFRRPAEVEAFGIAGNSPMGHTAVVVHSDLLSPATRS